MMNRVRSRRGTRVGLLAVGLLAVAILAPRAAAAQRVETFQLAGSPALDGLFVAGDGRMFGAGTFRGRDVYLIHPDGSYETFASGFQGPVDLGMDGAGNLYVSNFNAASISRIAPDGAVSVHARVPDGPAGVVVDDDGTVFVAHYGRGNGTGRSISRIAPDGAVSEFARSDEMIAPLGLARGPGGHLYAANFYNGKVFRIDASGELSLFAQVTLPNGAAAPIGHLGSGDGGLIVTTLARNRIYKISASGEVSLVAGDDAAEALDGPFEMARFQRPNGIAEAPDGSVYIATAGNGPGDRSTLRRLVFGRD